MHVVLRLLLVEHAHKEFSIFWNKIRRCLPGPGARRRWGRALGNRAGPARRRRVAGEREKLGRSAGEGSDPEGEKGQQGEGRVGLGIASWAGTTA